MSTSQTPQTNNPPDDQDDPWEKHVPNAQEQQRHDAAMKKLYQYRERKQLKKILNLTDGTNGHLRYGKRSVKLRPGEQELIIDGKRYILDNKDPEVQAQVLKQYKKYQQVKQSRGDTAGTLPQLSKAVEITKARTPAGDAMVIAALNQILKQPKDPKASDIRTHVKQYIEHAVHDRWPELEALIVKTTFSVCATYWKSVFGTKRWPTYERMLLNAMDNRQLNVVDYVVNYTEAAIKHPWGDLAGYLINYVKSQQTTMGTFSLRYFSKYATITGGNRNPEMERMLEVAKYNNNYDIAIPIQYMKATKMTSWPKLEQNLLKQGNTQCIVMYANEIMNRRWPDAEVVLEHKVLQAATSNDSGPNHYLDYATHMLLAKIPPAVWTRIVKLAYPSNLFDYANKVLGKRNQDIEDRMEHEYKTQSQLYIPPEARKYIKLFKNGSWPKIGV